MLDSILFILSTTLMYSAPLIFAAIGGVLSENTGVVNIGLEGMMAFGAFVGAATTSLCGNPWIGLGAAGMAGLLLALLHAWASIHMAANQVVSGIAINFLGTGLSVFACRILFEGSTMTPPIPLENKIPPLFFGQYATVYLALGLVFFTHIFLYKTIWGPRWRAVGEHPKAAESVGINVYQIRYLAVLASGFCAGLGGASLSIAVVSSFRPTLIAGQGFIALAAVIFGRWRPMGAMWAALLFGASQALVVFVGGQAAIEISSQILSMLPYLLTLLILVFMNKKSAAPKANGISYQRN
ncbi:MAG: sugar ABC transporter permease [Bdellovibrionales bacterium RIFOXYD12_FULL_39_22]|nr:MAG: sugar ABC transporter permease [Bdellovibrionales bacterium RIFOXYB1_FULL_39_21]OFZ40751.1 MAG: sugar ABC transporter permease [Bdellovibrionales bacterium RIFOXYC12_FULL_39_17]OFZ48173.1 MAG: sugar ABC transporter permease [Bdellovibrionales bacterium RIFOXYC1_FULL_39_130]OFZ75823.1 MAG: sugar ABC transporter permease [Bdellovibrionales bacterium RIFOXYD1_FULL_39_84]OFZ91884.1 MAG: sugar ABC transporter permease [Bdellovibrionales bacterium RIFOXYD12_FULL_39_22]HLE11393.1 ABC transpor